MLLRFIPLLLVSTAIANPILVPGDVDGSGVVVAVLDTGIDFEHPDFAGRVIERVYVKEGPNGAIAVLPSDIPPGSGHGTHVAGIIGGSGIHGDGRHVGWAPGVQFVDIQFLDTTSFDASYPIEPPVEHAVAALNWLAENKDRLGISIVHNSWGLSWRGDMTCEEHRLSQAIQSIDDEHLLWIFAAGNNGPAADITVPACLPQVLTVGAVDANGKAADFSSRGPTRDGVLKPEVAAVGVDVLSTEPVGFCMPNVCDDDGYGTRSGTSMAAPQVTGMAALMRQADPTATAADIRMEIIGPEDSEWSPDIGYGIASLERVEAIPDSQEDSSPATGEAAKETPMPMGWVIAGLGLAAARLTRVQRD